MSFTFAGVFLFKIRVKNKFSELKIIFLVFVFLYSFLSFFVGFLQSSIKWRIKRWSSFWLKTLMLLCKLVFRCFPIPSRRVSCKPSSSFCLWTTRTSLWDPRCVVHNSKHDKLPHFRFQLYPHAILHNQQLNPKLRMSSYCITICLNIWWKPNLDITPLSRAI